MVNLGTIIEHLESIAPPIYQESYDNSGLIVGQKKAICTGVITCLDTTEAVVDEAIENKCNLIVAHHPIVFKGLKRFNGNNYVERVVMKAIKNDIAIYAIHTNLDNVYAQGVNGKIAERIGLVNTQILAPKSNLRKGSVVISNDHVEKLEDELRLAGAGGQTSGEIIRYRYNDDQNKIKLSLVFPQERERAIRSVLEQYKNADFWFDSIDELNALTGSGLVGELVEPMPEKLFLEELKTKLNLSCIKYTRLNGQLIRKVALCGGAGGFLLSKAIRSEAQIFITSDYKYHEFFDAEGKIIIADVGHFESEQFTIELLAQIIREKFSTFAVRLTKINTNPVNYI